MKHDCEVFEEGELATEFGCLFPQGFAGPDVLAELAPDGWELSPLVRVYHPSLEQVHEESLRVHRNIASLKRSKDPSPDAPEPTWEETARNYRETAVEPERELRELVGQCLWDIFSDSHDVVAADERRLDLGSFRGSAGFLAEVLNSQVGTTEYDYLHFYLGTIWVSGRADLAPVYRMIFRRLRARGLDWIYHFPRLYAVDLRPLKKALEEKEGPDWENYDPSQAVAEQEEERDHDEKLAQLRESLEEGFQEAVEEAVTRPPPPTVQAYQEVYGCFPNGWPPQA